MSPLALPLAALLAVAGYFPGEAGPVDVTILSSRVNQLAFEQREINYREGVQLWSAAAREAGLTYRVAGDYELENDPKPSAVWVVHHAEKLTEAQVQNLEKLKAQGTSMILVGLTGVEAPDGGKRTSLPERWLDLKEARPFAAVEGAYFTFIAGSILAVPVVPGKRMGYAAVGTHYIASTPKAMAVSVLWAYLPDPSPGPLWTNALVAAGTSGPSRVAWFGMSPEAVLFLPPQRAPITSALAATLRWAARRPVATACFWPGCARSASVVTADVEGQFENGEAIAAACRQVQARGSWFLLGMDAEKFPEVTRALAENGEVGSHSQRHTAFKDVPYAEQLADLEESKAAIVSAGVTAVSGFRPPMEEYDENTMRAVLAADLSYVFGDIDYETAYPMLQEVQGRTLVRFARTVPDDYHYATEKQVSGPQLYAAEYLRDFARIDELGGLYPFAFHTTYLGLPENVGAIPLVVEGIRKAGSLLTTFGELADWVVLREQVLLSMREEPGTVHLVIANTSGREVKAFPIQYFAPDDAGMPVLVNPPQGVSLRRAPVQGFAVLVDLAVGEEKEIVFQTRASLSGPP